MSKLFNIIASLSEAAVEDIESFIAAATETARSVRANPGEFITEERNSAQLLAEMESGVVAIEAAKAELASRNTNEEADTEEETEVEETEEPSAEAEIDTEALEALAARAEAEPEVAETETEPVTATLEIGEPIVNIADVVTAAVTAAVTATQAAARGDVEDTEVDETEETEEAVTASAVEKVRLARPGRATRNTPAATEDAVDEIALTAAAENLGYGIGEVIPDELALASMMIKRRRQFGKLPDGTHDKVIIASSDWTDRYDESRTLHKEFDSDSAKIAAVIDGDAIRAAFDARRKQDDGSLVASGGLCAPVTPYYGLQMISVADRPVRSSLPSFNADRGGINAARPAALTAIDTNGGGAIDILTEAEDAAGGTIATKSCQRIDCPSFVEVDVDTIYHCLEFGNLGARTFPELVAQWTSLTLAAHARVAEGNLLTHIGDASTAVTAASLGYGASAALLGQILAAANGMRSRHRMRQDAVLRLMLPSWVGDLIVSDVSRGQFDRFDMTPERWVSLLRQGNVEPTFYVDTASGAGQVFASQGASALLSFPANVVWYLFPEGSFLYLDGGTLELGLVRDSVLNATNDFQIFGETFENVAFIGVESLKVTSAVCDTGVVAAPDDPAYDCTNYS